MTYQLCAAGKNPLQFFLFLYDKHRWIVFQDDISPFEFFNAMSRILINTFVFYFHKEKMISAIVVFVLKSLRCWKVFPEEHFQWAVNPWLPAEFPFCKAPPPPDWP